MTAPLTPAETEVRRREKTIARALEIEAMSAKHTPREIATKLGIGINAVYTRLSRATEVLGRDVTCRSGRVPKREGRVAEPGAPSLEMRLERASRCKVCGLLEPHECISRRVEDYARRAWNACTDGG